MSDLDTTSTGRAHPALLRPAAGKASHPPEGAAAHDTIRASLFDAEDEDVGSTVPPAPAASATGTPAAPEGRVAPPAPSRRRGGRSALAALVVAAAAGGTHLVPIERPLPAQAVVEPRGETVRLSPTEPSVLADLRVRTGDAVRSGQPVAAIVPVGAPAEVTALMEKRARIILLRAALGAALGEDVAPSDEVAAATPAARDEAQARQAEVIARLAGFDRESARLRAAPEAALAARRAEAQRATEESDTSAAASERARHDYLSGASSLADVVRLRADAARSAESLGAIEAAVKAAEGELEAADRAVREDRARAVAAAREEIERLDAEAQGIRAELAHRIGAVRPTDLSAPADLVVVWADPSRVGTLLQPGDAALILGPERGRALLSLALPEGAALAVGDRLDLQGGARITASVLAVEPEGKRAILRVDGAAADQLVDGQAFATDLPGGRTTLLLDLVRRARGALRL